MTIVADDTFDYLDKETYFIEKDEKVTAYIQNMPVQDKIIHQYNQSLKGKVTTNLMCTCFSNAIAVSSLFNQEWTREQLEAACMVGVNKFGMRLTGGNNTHSGAKAIASYNNATFNNKAVFFVAQIFDEWFEKALDKGLLAVVSLMGVSSGNLLFFAQLLTGKIIGGKNMKVKQGHAICIGRGENGGYVFYNSDSKLSKATCTKEVMQDLVRQGVFFSPARIWLPLIKISTLSPEAYAAVQSALQGNSNVYKYLNAQGQALTHTTNEYLRTL